ncbi:TetR/AcrR family transcriptional regulator [Deinococcus hopiensis]|uniref:Transcriptional regulator, TetR family n=1 Tax=Deinococcus hopiensis KR-140 TaxID=695939 RepID=A0A1W1UQ78_9DEIO|nr:TetR/AcrR family transcriptional regulator [Deinococcus hopiensis]SMB83220.1 transcriptional regulator, TetR family [Deinococcus hopiensis KR-140]
MSTTESIEAKALESWRKRNKQETLDRIKQAASTLFIQQGFTSSTIRGIADLAGVAPGTVFFHVRDKADLLLMVFSDYISNTTVKVFERDYSQETLSEALFGIFKTYIDLYQTHPELSRYFVKESLFQNGPWQCHVTGQTRSIVDQLAMVLNQCWKFEEIQQRINAQQFAFVLFGLYQIILLKCLSGELSYEDALIQLKEQFEIQTNAFSVPSVPNYSSNILNRSFVAHR